MSLHLSCRESSENCVPLPKDPNRADEVCQICGAVPQREVSVYHPASGRNPQR